MSSDNIVNSSNAMDNSAPDSNVIHDDIANSTDNTVANPTDNTILDPNIHNGIYPFNVVDESEYGTCKAGVIRIIRHAMALNKTFHKEKRYFHNKHMIKIKSYTEYKPESLSESIRTFSQNNYNIIFIAEIYDIGETVFTEMANGTLLYRFLLNIQEVGFLHLS